MAKAMVSSGRSIFFSLCERYHLPSLEFQKLEDLKTIQLISYYQSLPNQNLKEYVGTEVKLNGSNDLILKEDDIVGILESDDIKDLKPQNDRVLIKVAMVGEKTAGGLYLTYASKEKPSIGTVVSVGLVPWTIKAIGRNCQFPREI